MTLQPVDIQFPLRNGQMRLMLSRQITKREFETIKKVIDLMEDSIVIPETAPPAAAE